MQTTCCWGNCYQHILSNLECGSDVLISKFVQKIFIFTSCNSWCGRIMTCFLCNLRDCVKHLTSQRPGAERSDRVHGRPHFESHNNAKSKLYHKIFQKRRSKTSKWLLQLERANWVLSDMFKQFFDSYYL